MGRAEDRASGFSGHSFVDQPTYYLREGVVKQLPQTGGTRDVALVAEEKDRLCRTPSRCIMSVKRRNPWINQMLPVAATGFEPVTLAL